jgi:hypothetical protein
VYAVSWEEVKAVVALASAVMGVETLWPSKTWLSMKFVDS